MKKESGFSGLFFVEWFLRSYYKMKKQIKPIIILMSAPPITSLMKCTPLKTLVIPITVESISMITPKLMSKYKNAIAIMNADAVWRLGKLLPFVLLATAGV